MADSRELFPVLAASDGAGVPLDQMQQGNDPTSKNGSIGFAFRDSSGNVVLPQLDSAGRLPVITEGLGGTRQYASGVATPSALLTDTDVITETLTVSTDYIVGTLTGSSFHSTLWKLIFDDDGSETELARFLTGPGDFNHTIPTDCIQFSAGATGTQELKVVAQQLWGKLSDMHASLCYIEVS